MAEWRQVRTVMPDPKSVLGGAINNFPERPRWGEQEVKRQALVEHRDLIASGARVEVIVPEYGRVRFHFSPSEFYSQPGAHDGEFIPG